MNLPDPYSEPVLLRGVVQLMRFPPGTLPAVGHVWDTDEEVRAWAGPWCNAWFLPWFLDLHARLRPSHRREKLKVAAMHSMRALSFHRMPPASTLYRDRLMRELEALYRLLAVRRGDALAIDAAAWRVVGCWCDLATTGELSDE